MRTRNARLFLGGSLIVGLVITGCSPKPEATAGFQAACEGPPLGSIERRNQAMEDGYGVNRRYDCIDKASFAAVREQRLRWEVANTPEAIARREEEYAEARARYAEQRAREAAAPAAGAASAAGMTWSAGSLALALRNPPTMPPPAA